MPKGRGQKRKLLQLERILRKHSDEEHPMSMERIMEELERCDITAERKSIYDDMAELQQCGLDIQMRRGKNGGWFLGDREFQLPELKFLVDAVQSSRFLTTRKSNELIARLESLTSEHQARQLQRQVYVSGRVKSMNESIYYNVDKLHAAIHANRTIFFRYFSYNSKKEKVFRRDGKRYHVVPSGLVLDGENYYLVAWSLMDGEFRHYRVDKMTEITITSFPREKEHLADMTSYAQKHFGMFAGREGMVKLQCREELASIVLDRFGQDTILVPREDGTFSVTLDVVVSPQFWGWVFGLGAGVRVLEPAWAAEEYRAELKVILEQQTAE